MATLTIRNLDDSVRESLRARARSNGRSTEAEVRAILEASVAGLLTTSGNRVKPCKSLREVLASIEPVDVPGESAMDVLNELREDRV